MVNKPFHAALPSSLSIKSPISSSRMLRIDSNAAILSVDIGQPFNGFLGNGFSKLDLQAE